MIHKIPSPQNIYYYGRSCTLHLVRAYSLFLKISNRIFIEKMKIVFMMMNTLDMKKIQKAQKLTADS